MHCGEADSIIFCFHLYLGEEKHTYAHLLSKQQKS